MSFATDDRNMLDEWLTVGPAAALVGCSARDPRVTRLLGATVHLWNNADGEAQARLGEQPLRIMNRYGYLWICPSGEPARPLFELPEYDELGRRIVDCAGVGVAVSGLRVVENFLDMAHFPFVHPNFLGTVSHTEVLDYSVEVDADTQEIWATDCRFWQPRASAAASDGVLASYRYRVMQPFSAALYKTCVHRSDALDAIGLFVQPLEEDRSIAYVLLLYFEDQLSDTELIGFQQLIFAQDKPILENHAIKRLPLEAGIEAPARADATSFVYRRWLRSRGLRYGVHSVAVA